MSTSAATSTALGTDLLAAFTEHHEALGGQPDYRRRRLAAARAFLDIHPDLDEWMAMPVDARLVELHRRNFAWPVVAFAIASGHTRADVDFLFAKNFGHSMARWIACLFPGDVDRLRTAADRLGAAAPGVAVREVLPLAVAFAGRSPSSLTVEDLDALCEAIDTTPRLTEAMRRSRRGHLFRLRRLLFEAGMVELPAQHRRQGGPATRQARLASVAAPGVRRSLVAYLDVRATVLRPKTIDKLTSALAIFGEFICGHDPQLRSIASLERRHIEAFLAWTSTRASRGSHDPTRAVGPHVHAHAAITLRGFLDDITAWGWADAPRRRLMFDTDIPRQPESLPRALPPDIDAAVMGAVGGLDDRFARIGITVLRHTGLRIGELLDLELEDLVDYAANGTWLRVPLGKLNTERSVPVDDIALEALNEWLAHRSGQRARPHPRDGHLADFIFVERGRRLGTARIQRGLRDAVVGAGLDGPDGQPLRVIAHQLRHTWATELANAGMSIQALMTLLGHRSPEMTIRYARLASPTLKAAYDQAAGKLARRIPVAPAGRPAAPDRVEWLAAEMLKTRVAHGYCSRDLAAEACPYANVCETCPNFVTTADFAPAVRAQLDDVRQLREDAEARGWTSEAARHQRVITSLEKHLRRLKADSTQGSPA
ncbi:MAG: tyrosine-type recombinase/integrase [Candidatus Dormibacteraeota bacterium]|nr:tyrosine-type recombinase/integrase [Candidatus Dormibacteraeota bacterium]